jgi:hypothetical protein
MFGKLIGLLLLLGVTQSFYFGVNRKQICLLFKPTNETYHFSYQINAIEPKNLHIVAQTVHGQHIQTFQ